MELPNYREFYETRHFASGALVRAGSELLLAGRNVPIPPSSYAAMAGATVIANLSASNAIVDKSDDRHALCRVL